MMSEALATIVSNFFLVQLSELPCQTVMDEVMKVSMMAL